MSNETEVVDAGGGIGVTVPKAAKRPKPKAAKMSQPKTRNVTKNGVPECTCGCGKHTKGGRFRPGHDAQLKGRLQTEFKEKGKLSAASDKLVSELGWERFIRKEGAPDKTLADAREAGVTVPQLHILRTLAKHPRGLTRPEIKDKSGVAMSLTHELGPVFHDDLAKVEKRSGVKSLIARHLVTRTVRGSGDNEEQVYVINGAGKKVIGK